NVNTTRPTATYTLSLHDALPISDEVAAAYGTRPKYGREYIIPVPFDPRLISAIPPAIAKAAMDTGVARKPIPDMEAYTQQLRSRSEEHTSELQSRSDLVCRLLLE